MISVDYLGRYARSMINTNIIVVPEVDLVESKPHKEVSTLVSLPLASGSQAATRVAEHYKGSRVCTVFPCGYAAMFG